MHTHTHTQAGNRETTKNKAKLPKERIFLDAKYLLELVWNWLTNLIPHFFSSWLQILHKGEIFCSCQTSSKQAQKFRPADTEVLMLPPTGNESNSYSCFTTSSSHLHAVTLTVKAHSLIVRLSFYFYIVALFNILLDIFGLGRTILP